MMTMTEEMKQEIRVEWILRHLCQLPGGPEVIDGIEYAVTCAYWAGYDKESVVKKLLPLLMAIFHERYSTKVYSEVLEWLWRQSYSAEHLQGTLGGDQPVIRVADLSQPQTP
jgi:hypothetical protein